MASGEEMTHRRMWGFTDHLGGPALGWIMDHPKTDEVFECKNFVEMLPWALLGITIFVGIISFVFAPCIVFDAVLWVPQRLVLKVLDRIRPLPAVQP